MKVFVFSDLHAQSKQLYNLEHFFDTKNDIDVLIFAGDAVNMGEPVGFMVNFIEVIEKIGLPFFWVPGNNDFGRSYHKLNAKFPSLEGKIIVLNRNVISSEVEKSHARKDPHALLDLPAGKAGPPTGLRRAQSSRGLAMAQDDSLRLTGVGGSPASWAGQYAGEKMIDRKAIAGSIFVSHTPPPGLLTMVKHDVESQQYNNGTIKQLSDSPIVHICGHLHSRWGCGYLGTTKVINPGPLADGRYAIMDTNNLKVEFGRFK